MFYVYQLGVLIILLIFLMVLRKRRKRKNAEYLNKNDTEKNINEDDNEFSGG